MDIGDTLELTIDSLAFGGDAIARAGGWVVFIPAALPGEKVSVEITEKKTNFYRGKLLKVLQPSPNRVASPCAYFPECGGCQYLHFEYSAQLAAKCRQVEDALQRLGKVAFPPIKVMACPQPFHYRNRVKFHVQRKGQKVQLGFIGTTGRHVVPVEQCLISDPAINTAIAPIEEQLKKSPAAKTVTVRTNAPGIGHPEKVVDFWTENLPIAKGNTLKETVAGKMFEAPSASFFQVNPAMNEILVREVEVFLPTDSEILIDAYCGVGLFSVIFGQRFREIIGIEQDQDSVRWARKNMRANGIETGVFYEGKTEQLLEKALTKTQGKRRTVILDPPRDGLHQDIPKLLSRVQPEQIIYVSCNPPTLARDLGRLSPAFTIVGVTLVDMFPQTMHCEVIIDLRPLDANQ